MVLLDVVGKRRPGDGAGSGVQQMESVPHGAETHEARGDGSG